MFKRRLSPVFLELAVWSWVSVQIQIRNLTAAAVGGGVDL